MKGNYNNENKEGRFIFAKDTKVEKNGFFQPDFTLDPPGKAKQRLSLRIGLYKFSEGITLSYASTFDDSENYCPFTPFAFTSDPEHKRPFILYYDPKVETGKGPIVIHGGFTSAFYDFEQDGTGKLVISIACWLTRREEALCNLKDGFEKVIPGIKIPLDNNKIFDKWIKLNNTNTNMYSILILDVSGSMKKYYDSLIDMTNKIIKNQMNNKENEGVVILFGSVAKTILNGKYNRLLNKKDIDMAEVGTQTDFYKSFKEAEKYIKNKNNFNKKRILFLTDGEADSSELNPICENIKKENFQINIVGFENPYNFRLNNDESSSFEHLRKFATKNCFYTSKNFNDIEIHCQNIFAAEY